MLLQRRACCRRSRRATEPWLCIALRRRHSMPLPKAPALGCSACCTTIRQRHTNWSDRPMLPKVLLAAAVCRHQANTNHRTCEGPDKSQTHTHLIVLTFVHSMGQLISSSTVNQKKTNKTVVANNFQLKKRTRVESGQPWIMEPQYSTIDIKVRTSQHLG